MSENADMNEALEAAGKLDRLRVLEINRLKAALQFYANPEIYKPHPHGLTFDSRDMSFHAKATLAQRGPEDGTCCRCGAAPRNASGLCSTCLDEDADLAGEIEAQGLWRSALDAERIEE